jgi:hypothetical protein
MMRFAIPLMAVLSLGLGACGGGIPGSGGGDPRPASGQESPGIGTTARNLFLFGTNDPPPIQQPKLDEKEQTCPAVDIIENAAGYRGSSSLAGSASAVSFQASITNTARECIFQGNQLRLRVGVEGRVLLGPNGKAGSYSVPIKIVVKRRKDTVTQRSTRLNVTVPGNDTQAEFAYVDESITLPISQFDPGDEYDIFVGLDPTGAQVQRQTRRR